MSYNLADGINVRISTNLHYLTCLLGENHMSAFKSTKILSITCLRLEKCNFEENTEQPKNKNNMST